MPPYFDVIVVGSYTIDLIFSGLKEFPQLGKDIHSTGFKATPGEAFISAVSLHRLGVKVGWAADFGTDEYSRLALRYAREEGLDESLFTFHDRPYQRISVSASSPYDRGFLTYYDPDPPIPAAIPALLKSQAKVLLIPGLFFGLLLDACSKILQQKHIKLVMDGNSSAGDITGKSRESKSIGRAIRKVDIFLPNAKEACRLTGETDLKTAIRKLGELCPLVVVKDGANGSYAFFDDTFIHIPGIEIAAVDTTGAGDNFNAGFLTAWIAGQSIETCLKWGNIAGALSTQQLGGTTFRLTTKIISEAYSKYYSKISLE